MMTSLFRIDPLSVFVGIFILFFSLMTILYSVGFMQGKKGLGRYYLYIVLTALTSIGAVLANHLILFIVFWGFLGVLLYVLIQFGETPRTSASAKKAFIMISGTDAFMILGIALIWALTRSFAMDGRQILLDNKFAFVAFLCLVMGAFAKAGAAGLGWSLSARETPQAEMS